MLQITSIFYNAQDGTIKFSLETGDGKKVGRALEQFQMLHDLLRAVNPSVFVPSLPSFKVPRRKKVDFLKSPVSLLSVAAGLSASNIAASGGKRSTEHHAWYPENLHLNISRAISKAGTQQQQQQQQQHAGNPAKKTPSAPAQCALTQGNDFIDTAIEENALLLEPTPASDKKELRSFSNKNISRAHNLTIDGKDILVNDLVDFHESESYSHASIKPTVPKSTAPQLAAPKPVQTPSSLTTEVFGDPDLLAFKMSLMLLTEKLQMFLDQVQENPILANNCYFNNFLDPGFSFDYAVELVDYLKSNNAPKSPSSHFTSMAGTLKGLFIRYKNVVDLVASEDKILQDRNGCLNYMCEDEQEFSTVVSNVRSIESEIAFISDITDKLVSVRSSKQKDLEALSRTLLQLQHYYKDTPIPGILQEMVATVNDLQIIQALHAYHTQKNIHAHYLKCERDLANLKDVINFRTRALCAYSAQVESVYKVSPSSAAASNSNTSTSTSTHIVHDPKIPTPKATLKAKKKYTDGSKDMVEYTKAFNHAYQKSSQKVLLEFVSAEHQIETERLDKWLQLAEYLGISPEESLYDP